MRFAIVKNGKELGERAFLEIKKVLDEKPDAVIGFATGNTPVPLYERMAEDHKRNGTSYKRVRAFNLDEYVGVDPNDKASFARFMRDNLFSKIDIDPANTDIPNGMAEDLAAECARYSAAVKEHPADIQILGIGENGHIAFNEPYTKPDEPTHIALLTASTRAANAGAFKDPSLVPQYALTMGIDEILTAKRILMLATGEKKAQAIYDMVMGRDDTSCPATARMGKGCGNACRGSRCRRRGRGACGKRSRRRRGSRVRRRARVKRGGVRGRARNRRRRRIRRRGGRARRRGGVRGAVRRGGGRETGRIKQSLYPYKKPR